MKNFDYPIETTEGEKFVLTPFQNNFGEWVPAQIGDDGLLIVDINAPKFKKYSMCHVFCKNSNEQYFTSEEISKAIETHCCIQNYLDTYQRDTTAIKVYASLTGLILVLIIWIATR